MSRMDLFEQRERQIEHKGSEKALVEPYRARPHQTMGAIVASAAAGLLLCIGGGGCANSCPSGRTPGSDGTCIREDVHDFTACINNAGGKIISKEEAVRINASVSQVAGGSEWQRKVLEKYDGPSAENQRTVIEHCTFLSMGGQSNSSGPSAKGGTFKKGDKRSAVLRVKGQPSSVGVYDSIHSEVWYFEDHCHIDFEHGRVKSWNNCPEARVVVDD